MQRLTGRAAVAVKPGSALIRCTALLGLVVSACAFPDYNFTLLQGSAGNAGLATGGAGTGGAGTGGSAGDHSGSGVAGEAMSSGGDGTAGTATGEGGAAGSTSGPKACADYTFLPKDCGCFDDAGRAYLLCTTSLPWSQAEAQCEFYDMTLVEIESPAQNDWILTQARAMTVPAPFPSFWIGGSSVGSPGTWHWPDGAVFWHGGATGTPVKNMYFDWRTNNPQNISSESCVAMDQDGWHDEDCTSDRSYVCEWQ